MVRQLRVSAKMVRILFLLIISWAVCACSLFSFFPGPTITALPLALPAALPAGLPSAAATDGRAWSLRQLDQSATVFVLSSAADSTTPLLYATAFKTCPTYSKTPQPRALFVGFTNVFVASQQLESAGNAALIRTEAKAVLAGKPLQLLIYSTQKTNCGYDLVFWRDQSNPEPRSWEAYFSDYPGLAALVAVLSSTIINTEISKVADE